MHMNRFGEELGGESNDDGASTTTTELVIEELLPLLPKFTFTGRESSFYQRKKAFTRRTLMVMAFAPEEFRRCRRFYQSLLKTGACEEDLVKIRRSDYLWTTEKKKKKGGGHRILTKPKKELKAVHAALVPMLNGSTKRIFDKASWLHGVRSKSRDTSFVSNASSHIGAKFVYTSDIQKCFDSITFDHVVQSLMRIEWLSVSPVKKIALDRDAAVFLASLMTYKRRLPQGAKTSPILANLVLLRFDHIVRDQLKKIDSCFTYTRYFDDLTISGNEDSKLTAQDFQRVCEEALGAACQRLGLNLNRKKTHFWCVNKLSQPLSADSIEVTGLQLNGKALALPKKTERFLRREVRRFEKFDAFVAKRFQAFTTEDFAKKAEAKRRKDAQREAQNNPFDRITDVILSGPLRKRTRKIKDNAMQLAQLLCQLRHALNTNCQRESKKAWGRHKLIRGDGGQRVSGLRSSKIILPEWHCFDKEEMFEVPFFSAEQRQRWEKAAKDLIPEHVYSSDRWAAMDPAEARRQQFKDEQKAKRIALRNLYRHEPEAKQHESYPDHWLRVRYYEGSKSMDLFAERAWLYVTDILLDRNLDQRSHIAWIRRSDVCAYVESEKKKVLVYDSTGLIPALLEIPPLERFSFYKAAHEWLGRCSFHQHLISSRVLDNAQHDLFDRYKNSGLKSLEGLVEWSRKRGRELPIYPEDCFALQQFEEEFPEQSGTVSMQTNSLTASRQLSSEPESKQNHFAELFFTKKFSELKAEILAFAEQSQGGLPYHKNSACSDALVQIYKRCLYEEGERQYPPKFSTEQAKVVVLAGQLLYLGNKKSDDKKGIFTVTPTPRTFCEVFHGDLITHYGQLFREGLASTIIADLQSNLDSISESLASVIEEPSLKGLMSLCTNAKGLSEGLNAWVQTEFMSTQIKHIASNLVSSFESESLVTKLRNRGVHGGGVKFQTLRSAHLHRVKLLVKDNKLPPETDVHTVASDDAFREAQQIQTTVADVLGTDVFCWESSKKAAPDDSVIPEDFKPSEIFELAASVVRDLQEAFQHDSD